MKLVLRFVLNLLSPAPIAATLLLTAAAILENGHFTESLRWLPIYVFFGYLYALLPSAAHAWWLHRRYRAGLDPRSGRAIALSTVSGFCAGLAVGLFLAAMANGNPGGLLIFVPLGAATGALNGLLHRLVQHPKPLRSAN